MGFVDVRDVDMQVIILVLQDPAQTGSDFHNVSN